MNDCAYLREACTFVRHIDEELDFSFQIISSFQPQKEQIKTKKGEM